MSTQTTSPAERTALLPVIPPNVARATATAGGVLTAASAFLAWTWTSAFPGDLTISGYPGGLQVLTLVAGVLTALFGLASYGVRGTRWLAPAGANGPVLLLALGALGTTWYTLLAISAELGGLANWEPGAWFAAIASVLAVVGALGLPFDEKAAASLGAPAPGATPLQQAWHTVRLALAPRPLRAAKRVPAYQEILIIVGILGLGLLVFTYGIGTAYGELFVGFLILAAFGVAAASKAGLLARASEITSRYRGVTMAGAFVAAALFPFTQTDDQYATVGVNILIFATVALGLNIVVGLAGLLDLGYVAFLGVGAYAAALVSGATASSIGVHFPFWAAVLTGAVASMVFGVAIGAPTLRLRGDYLAIVTLGFGEIFRIAVNNMDGKSGPDVTNGSNGIPNIPDVNIFGLDLGATHDIGGFTLGRFANYYLLMLLITAIVVLVFSRSGDSRIGRAWVAIREDETAALAMGINGFKVKLIAFALGASLAGLAGTVQAHVQYTVVPDPYQFAGPVPPNSAFLLAAVVLGGMGTISGPLLGAALLYLIPYKLQFMQDYQLLLFGVALVVLMRLRPEGMIASRRQKLEFHEDDEELLGPDPVAATGTEDSVGLSKAGA
ncbi:branched-chain amino acid ABC transporter permease [Wenjunlia tyrosinilytica]|jgi:branched-chain amino acid transport system permease protein|uniref:Branched-chain amino acid ABC transporter permease n=1 Tax=Wenjunlia tyrosinilytica TaxID=1544741 RepID=A0A918DTL8_9ACTN|nr:branched-chain amino acid ABC transporter permease [Wenjunlia tyrosinilytica]GGO81554.1 branched-chain amino acid ABC transporter permease [Wenjunlia tyrosinilytica]